MRLIGLPTVYGEVWVNPDHVTQVIPMPCEPAECSVWLGDEEIVVKGRAHVVALTLSD